MQTARAMGADIAMESITLIPNNLERTMFPRLFGSVLTVR